MANNLPVARDVLSFIIPELIITILLLFFGIISIGIIWGIIMIFVIYFFQGPGSVNRRWRGCRYFSGRR